MLLDLFVADLCVVHPAGQGHADSEGSLCDAPPASLSHPPSFIHT